MSTSPVDPQDIRAAAEIRRELGPEYDDAVIAAFIDRVDRAVAARVEARLAEERPPQPVVRDHRRRSLLKGVAIGVCAGALVAGVGVSHAASGAQQSQAKVFPAKGGPFGPGKNFMIIRGPNGQRVQVILPQPPPAPKS